MCICIFGCLVSVDVFYCDVFFVIGVDVLMFGWCGFLKLMMVVSGCFVFGIVLMWVWVEVGRIV